MLAIWINLRIILQFFFLYESQDVEICKYEMWSFYLQYFFNRLFKWQKKSMIIKLNVQENTYTNVPERIRFDTPSDLHGKFLFSRYRIHVQCDWALVKTKSQWCRDCYTTIVKIPWKIYCACWSPRRNHRKKVFRICEPMTIIFG
jgi:hypothetical protein